MDEDEGDNEGIWQDRERSSCVDDPEYEKAVVLYNNDEFGEDETEILRELGMEDIETMGGAEENETMVTGYLRRRSDGNDLRIVRRETKAKGAYRPKDLELY